MELLAESQTGKYAYYDEYGNRHLFISIKEHKHYIVQKTIEWIMNCCSFI